ncbi:MAG: C1 family peptidase [Deltaproteobacteria bacterium]|nr:C1 family peptidase [Deltaproteobacteria bacterium]
MSLLIERADGSKRKVSGYRYAAPRPGTKTWTADDEISPPNRVDLREFMTEVENQEDTNSCAANAVAGAYEYLVKRHLEEEAYDVSRLFIYYNGRAVDSCETEDEGSVIGSLIQSLKEHGACSEETWPFDKDIVNEQPSDEAYEEAGQFLVDDCALVPTDVDAWRAVLAEGYPIIFGISLFQSFDRQRKPGVVPMPSPRESSRESHGGHAMLAVGYSDRDRVFIVRNSWGTEWGDEGYCYIPYDYLCSERFNNGDSWIIRQVDGVDADAAWADDDESLLPEIDTELAEMSQEAFDALHEACGEVPLESRFAQLFLVVAGADGEITDEELSALAEQLDDLFARLGSELNPQRVLRFAMRHADDEDLLTHTIELFGEHLSQGLLANIIAKAQEIAESDELSEDEEDVIAALIEAWQIEE